MGGMGAYLKSVQRLEMFRFVRGHVFFVSEGLPIIRLRGYEQTVGRHL